MLPRVLQKRKGQFIYEFYFTVILQLRLNCDELGDKKKLLKAKSKKLSLKTSKKMSREEVTQRQEQVIESEDEHDQEDESEEEQEDDFEEENKNSRECKRASCLPLFFAMTKENNIKIVLQ